MVKQVIILRKDLNMRKGKMVAQGAHASMKVFFDRAKVTKKIMEVSLTDAMVEYFKGSFTKICVSVDSKKELFDIYRAAQHAKLPCSLILDAGKTEFDGPTYTAVAVGPAGDRKIDAITGHLKLL